MRPLGCAENEAAILIAFYFLGSQPCSLTKAHQVNVLHK